MPFWRRHKEPSDHCKICGKSIPRGREYCSNECRDVDVLGADHEPKQVSNPCKRCGQERIVSKFEGYPMFICIQCRLGSLKASDNTLDVRIGRVIKCFKDVSLVRILLEYPPEQRGKDIFVKAWFPRSRRFGDDKGEWRFRVGHVVAVAGKMLPDGKLDPYYYKDVTLGIESTGPYNLPPVGYKISVAGHKKPYAIRIQHPYHELGKNIVEKVLREYQSGILISARSVQSKAKDFELLVVELLKKLGYVNVLVTGGAGDKGVDIEAYVADSDGKPAKKILVQCKYQSPLDKVKPTQVRDFAHVIERGKAQGVSKGYFITSSYFSPECFDKANCGEDMELIDRDHLEKMLRTSGLSLDSLEK